MSTRITNKEIMETINKLAATLSSIDERVAKLESSKKTTTTKASTAKSSKKTSNRSSKKTSSSVKEHGGKVYKADRPKVYAKMPKNKPFDFEVYKATAIKLGVWHEA